MGYTNAGHQFSSTQGGRDTRMTRTIQVLDSDQISRTLERLAFEVIERHVQVQDLLIIGIQRRGVEIGARIKKILDDRLGSDIPLGKLDINLYRDDWSMLTSQPQINSTHIQVEVEDKQILLVDDVLYTGRTIRAALEGILDFGRPKKVELLVLVDRGHRELPIHADYVGKKVNTSPKEHVDVHVAEIDGLDQVVLDGSHQE